MKYGILFLIMAIMAAYVAMTSVELIPRILLLLITLALLIVAVAYLGNWPRLLLKNPDGRRGLWTWIFLWPYFGLVWLSFGMYRLLNRRDASTEIAPGVWLSRRLCAGEARRGSVQWIAIVDLAAEFQRIPLASAAYLSLPTLDGTPPSIEQLRQGVEWIDRHRAGGPVLIHCALGHGRSASVVIAWLVSSKLAGDVQSALANVQSLRPGVGLKPAQLNRLQEMFSSMPKNSNPIE